MNEDKQPGHDDGRIMMDHPALKPSPGPGGQVVAIADHIETRIDDMLFNPGTRRCSGLRALSNGPHNAIDDRSIEPIPDAAQLLRRLHEYQIVKFIDIIFMQQCRIDGWKSSSEFRRRLGANRVEIMRQAPP